MINSVFFTKSSQGSLFKKFRDLIMGMRSFSRSRRHYVDHTYGARQVMLTDGDSVTLKNMNSIIALNVESEGIGWIHCRG